MKKHLNAREAADRLGVSLATLYAYVSRKQIRSESLDPAKRTKSYNAEDVEKLAKRKEHRRDPGKAVKQSLDFGVPILESAITLIHDNQVYYRGYAARELAHTCSLEQVAALIWTGELPQDPIAWFTAPFCLPERCLAVNAHLEGLAPVEKFQAMLPLAAVDDLAAFLLQPGAIMATGARILRLFIAIAAQREEFEGPMAHTLANAWLPGRRDAADLIQSALILCADHELNVSSFTARCVASARANPYQVVLAGLAALQGAKHGRETDRVAAFLREVAEPTRARTAVARRIQREEAIPGFGHRLYPEGDPRGEMLIHLARKANPESPVLHLVDALIEAVETHTGNKPTLDTGLVVFASTLKLPDHAPLTLFALGRTIGWIGQALETYKENQLIRPRAKYVGEHPRPFP